MTKKKKAPASRLSVLVMVFYFLAFLLLALRDQSVLGYILAVAVPCMIFLGTSLLPLLFPTDRLLMSLTNFLCALGILLLYAANPAYALQQAVFYGIGLAAMVFCIYLVRSSRTWRRTVLLLIPLSLGLLALPLAAGEEINGARNWISLGPLSFQPSEIVKLLLLAVLSYYLSQRKPLPCLLFLLACMALLMLQKDLGTALLYFGTALLLYWTATGNLPFTLAGLAGGCAAAWLGYQQFAHVRLRVSLWLNPWADYGGAGYQIVQGLMALASGGLWGVGLGLGTPTAIPVYESDYIFAVLCEQFGLVFAVCVLLVYAVLILRGASVAISARRSFHGLLAMGSVVLIGLQTFLIIGGVLKLIPLTGVNLPFVSRGGTSLITSMCLAGFIQGVESLNEDDLEADAQIAMLER